jgi:hypothetical protein
VPKPSTRPPLRVAVERGSTDDSKMWGHVVALRRGNGRAASETFVPIEIGIAAAVLAAGDVYLLAISSHFSTVPRDLIRVVGGVLAVGLTLWIGFLVVALAVAGFILLTIEDIAGHHQMVGASPRIAIVLVGVAAGAAQGALAATYGPVTLIASGIAVVLAVTLQRSSAYRRRRHSAAIMGLVFLLTFAVANILVGLWVLAIG